MVTDHNHKVMTIKSAVEGWTVIEVVKNLWTCACWLIKKKKKKVEETKRQGKPCFRELLLVLLLLIFFILLNDMIVCQWGRVLFVTLHDFCGMAFSVVLYSCFCFV